MRAAAQRRYRHRWRVALVALAVLACLVVAGQLVTASQASHDNVLRIAMTSADLPTTTGAPTQGLEGMRFAGYPAFEPLVMWDLRVTDHPPGVIPWLATRWETDPADRNAWTFHLRKGVRFHDGSRFDADAVVWNLDRFYRDGVPQAEPSVAAAARARAPIIADWRKIDDFTVLIRTKVPTTYFPEVLTGLLMVSPAHWKALGGDWQAFAHDPSGTGPFRITEVDRTAITMRRFPGYWNKARSPRLDGVVVQAMVEPTTRIAALVSGEVDWVENPPSDGIPYLRRHGFTVSTSPMPHVWAYWLRMVEGSPFRDVRVRQAMNYAVDRQGLVALLNGAAEPASGFWKSGDPRFGNPGNHYSYDPARARALLTQAGYPADKLLPVRVLVSPSGSGQMMGLPMNELLQQSARRAGFDLSFKVVDYGQLAPLYSNPEAREMRGVMAVNKGWSTADMTWTFYSFMSPNVIGFDDPQINGMMRRYRTDFTLKNPEVLLARIHERVVDQAPWAWIVHDVNPRAFSSRVRGYTPSQSWFTDLTTVYLAAGPTG